MTRVRLQREVCSTGQECRWNTRPARQWASRIGVPGVGCTGSAKQSPRNSGDTADKSGQQVCALSAIGGWSSSGRMKLSRRLSGACLYACRLQSSAWAAPKSTTKVASNFPARTGGSSLWPGPFASRLTEFTSLCTGCNQPSVSLLEQQRRGCRRAHA